MINNELPIPIGDSLFSFECFDEKLMKPSAKNNWNKGLYYAILYRWKIGKRS